MPGGDAVHPMDVQESRRDLWRGNPAARPVPDVACPDITCRAGTEIGRWAPLAAQTEEPGADPVLRDDNVGRLSFGPLPAVDGVAPAGEQVVVYGHVSHYSEVLEQADGVSLPVGVEDGVVPDHQRSGVPVRGESVDVVGGDHAQMVYVVALDQSLIDLHSRACLQDVVVQDPGPGDVAVDVLDPVHQAARARVDALDGRILDCHI